VQHYFEQRVGWGAVAPARVYSLLDPPDDMPMFPFEVGGYGTGANFAVDRKLVLELGGFNEALGAGTPTGGGEDLEIFVRVLFARRPLVREPSALTWHTHRSTEDAARRQMRFYGTGLVAFIVATLATRDSRRMALSKWPLILRRLRGFGSLTTDRDDDKTVADDVDPAMREVATQLRRVEIKGAMVGPFTYLKSRAGGRRARPLKNYSSTLGESASLG
jgi:hypothetical protein